ncbi:MAG: hypothetical protein B6I30_09615 [Desulfobacteraceae bacterium 4572_187]|nr:MAG: hypothetical protein B6I30_09615 [Desulfobacteraceae bacterium 4572_187]
MNRLNELTPARVRRVGREALRDKLGPAGALKFILDYDRGEGDYTELRRKIFQGKTVKNIIQDMKSSTP